MCEWCFPNILNNFYKIYIMKSFYKILLISFILLLSINSAFSQKGLQINIRTGYGVDLSIGENRNHYTFDIDGQNGGVDILNPFFAGANISYQFNHWGVSVGVSGTKRPLEYVLGTRDQVKERVPLKIRYWVYETPIEIFYRHSIFKNIQLRYSLGLSVGWSGKTDPFRFNKGYFVEDRWKADLLIIPDGSDELLVLTDEGEYPIGKVGIEVLKQLGQNMHIGLSIRYHHQLVNEEITYFSLWGYDAKNDKRINGYNPRKPVYRSMFFQVVYYVSFHKKERS